jgi:NNP family nitrate/nitrite transporter-like MFS transporter
MPETQVTSAAGQGRALWMSTIAFTVCFAVWTIFAIIGVQIKQQLNLNETEFGLLVGTPILTGSLIRLALGIWTDQYGGRVVYTVTMLAAAVATYLLAYAHTYPQVLIAALGVGIAGGSFAVGIAYVSRWYPTEKQGTALGIFGAGNVGAAVTKFVAPFVLVAYGWQVTAQVWAAGIAIMAVVFWFTTTDDPVLRARRARGEKPTSAWLELAPLKNIQVWRFSLYYFFVFGAFVALSLWLPRYLISVYSVPITTAGMIAAAFSFPASVFRAYGGHLSDRYGARRVMYWTFLVAVAATFVLSYPPGDYIIRSVKGPIAFHMEMGVVPFTVTVFVLGFFMALGKAAVYKHIPVYYPKNVGSVGGLVGMIGGLGGFVLPIAFGALLDLTGVWTSCFMLLFVLVTGALVWMHLAIRQMERGVVGAALKELPELPEMQEIHKPEHVGALSGISGATLRIFYSFMVPIFGGRLWTTLATWSLIFPAVGIGYAVQHPETPYFIFLGLALLCGFGGGNFASSMANISFFFPRAEKGNALALNAGLGNLGVSVVQFVVPIAITAGVFGWLGGDPQPISATGKLWLQNAGFIWVPFIAASAFAAWFGMNDIASAKASFSEQAVIFERKHNWIMCWLYTGTFGSFIGYSAGFPLLAKTQFPSVDALQFVFLGPLVGALSRSATGWVSDKFGGGRVTIWVWVLMMIGVLGVLYFLGIKDQPYAFWGFFAMFLVLFFAAGVGNASTFQMIPNIMRKEMDRLMPSADRETRLRQAEKESAAITGFTSAIAAFGAFFVPKSYGTSIAMTGGVQAALWGFLAFYVSCLVITWGFYTRRGGLLYDVERGTSAPPSTPSSTPRPPAAPQPAE